jgi:hypothetical protein
MVLRMGGKARIICKGSGDSQGSIDRQPAAVAGCREIDFAWEQSSNFRIRTGLTTP